MKGAEVSLADRIEAAAPLPRKLTINEWFLSLDPQDRKAAEHMAQDRNWSNVKIIEFLASEGVAAGKDSVAGWRLRCGHTR